MAEPLDDATEALGGFTDALKEAQKAVKKGAKAGKGGRGGGRGGGFGLKGGGLLGDIGMLAILMQQLGVIMRETGDEVLTEIGNAVTIVGGMAQTVLDLPQTLARAQGSVTSMLAPLVIGGVDVSDETIRGMAGPAFRQSRAFQRLDRAVQLEMQRQIGMEAIREGNFLRQGLGIGGLGMDQDFGPD